ncbi:MAG: leucine-rich repeat protein, partial [Solobacterium sp.]|nr:leucine-rich repeat protein [Solobacterium sp.]
MKKQIRKTGTLALAALLFAGSVRTDIYAEETIEETVEDTYSGGELKESDELLDEYLEREITAGAPSGRRKAPRGNSLEGNNAYVYAQLQEMIALTAEGGTDSTAFGIPLEDPFKAVFTKEELGVDAIIVFDEEQQKKVISDEAKAALGEKLYDLDTVVNALIADVPYELYWYDKTIGANGKYGLSASSNTLTVTSLTISMAVSYAYNPDGKTGTYTVDTAKTSAVPAAVAKAKEIRDEAASMSDYNKLVYYKEQICGLTSYNYNAVNSNEPYGDPWQIISVFDGDPSTNVVCEGYSKSFKYLCDLSSFSDSKTEALLMTGTMNGGTGEGRHMWNAVRMDDGLYYLVDVTNCDSGTAGSPDKLFLAGSGNTSASGFTIRLTSSKRIKYTYDDSTLAMYSDAERMLTPHYYGVPYSIVFDMDELQLAAGENAFLPYTLLPEGTDTSVIEWSSTDPSVATVSGGTVTAVSPGVCIIDAVIGSSAASVSVKVVPQPESIVVPQTSFTLKEDETALIGASVYPEEADQTITYTSSDSSVASVDDSGLITAVSEGTAVITLETVNGIAAAVEVTVEREFADFEYTVSDTGVTITKYTGSAADPVIPSVIGGLPVTAIGDYAFESCESIRSAVIPESVTSIGNEAFESCVNLEHITVPAGAVTIGNFAFSSCSSLTTAGPAGSGANIEFGWTEEIPAYAFEGCTGLQSAVIPDTVTKIGKYAFDSCIGLESVTIPGSVTAVGVCAFRDCVKLEKVTIPAGVVMIGMDIFSGCTLLRTAGPEGSGADIEFGWTEEIPEYAFYGCTNLTEVTIPEGITLIGWHAFYNCENLGSVTIPASVETIEDNAFGFMNGGMVEGFEIYGYIGTGAQRYAEKFSITFIPLGTDTNDFEIESDGTSVTVKGYTGTASQITVPSEIDGVPVVSIARNAFRECTGLETVVISEGITSIGHYAFMDCTGLTSVTVPDSITDMGDEIFGGCTSLQYVTLPSGLTAVPDHTFSGCTALTDIVLPETVQTIGAGVFKDCTGLTSAVLPAGLESIGNSAFYHCGSLSRITIPAGTVSIGNNAFSGCSSLTSAGPSGGGWDYEFGWTEEIPANAFEGCDGLVHVIIPRTIKVIGADAFYLCGSLENITLPEGLTSIGSRAFSVCSKLESMEIPAGTVSIGDRAFESCNSLKEIVLPEGLTSIGSRAFTYCLALNGVTLPDTLESVGADAFVSCGRITAVTIPASVTSIGAYAFGFKNLNTHEPVAGFTICGYAGTAAETYAHEHEITFVDLVRTIPDDAAADIAPQTYTGTEIRPPVTVTVDGTVLAEGTDYTVSYENNINAGTASVTVTGKGNYKGTITREFTIKPKAVSPGVALDKTSYTYNGKQQFPAVTVKDGETVLTEGTDYEITYPAGMTNAGTYTVNVDLKGNYSGSGAAAYTIAKASQKVT